MAAAEALLRDGGGEVEDGGGDAGLLSGAVRGRDAGREEQEERVQKVLPGGRTDGTIEAKSVQRNMFGIHDAVKITVQLCYGGSYLLGNSFRYRVVKSIRLHLDEVEDELRGRRAFKHLDPSTKILLLVRDPRGVINSQLKMSTAWPASYSAAANVCGRILRDLDSVEKVRSRGVQIKVVRYEDLVDDAWWQVRDLLDFLERPDLLGEVAREVRAHVLPSERRGFQDGERFYYDTRRKKDFSHDGWRESLPDQKLEEIMSDKTCLEVLDRLGYKEKEVK